MFKAKWHPNKNSLSQSTGALFARGSPSSVGGNQATKDVAVKVLKRNLSSPVDRTKFENEIKIYATLKSSHPNVSLFYGISFDEDHMVIVGEYLDGGILPDWMSQKHPKAAESEGFWSVLCSVVRMIAQGMAFLHQNYVVWNNVNSAQCLVSKNNVVKICHFHSSHVLQQDDPLAELHFRNEVVQLGLVALNLALPKGATPITVRTTHQHGSSNIADQILASAAIPAAWPETVRDLISAMIRTDLEPRLSAKDVAERVRKLLDL